MHPTFPISLLDRLVASQAAMNAAHFLALPVLALHFSAVPDVGPAGAGVALGVFLAIARIGPLVTGLLADRIGAWQAIRLGLVLRSLGLAAIPFAETATCACLATAVLGAGVALHEPAVYGALGLAPEGKRDRLLMRHVQALNFGCVVGPGLALVAGWSTATIFWIASTTTGLVTLWACVQRPLTQQRPDQFTPRARKVIDWRFMSFAAALVPFWALFAQLFSALPMLVAKAGGSEAWAQSVILINGLVGFVVVPLILPALQRYGPRPILIVGCAIAAISVGLLDSSVALSGLLLLIMALSMAETAVTAAADILTARHANGRDVASRFGILAVGTGIGTALGAPLGVVAATGEPILLAILGAFGALSCAAAFALPVLRPPRA
ncbi:MAG: MFS transporter [Rhodobacteraceae bacterium]|jgi:predicted MFS family arabinose efflux permease|nr:MFS transporter [Paracoccaceae bacterium]